MDKTNEKFDPHKMWNCLRKANDLLALIGSSKEFNLPIPIEYFLRLNGICEDLLSYSDDFLDYAKNRDDK